MAEDWVAKLLSLLLYITSWNLSKSISIFFLPTLFDLFNIYKKSSGMFIASFWYIKRRCVDRFDQRRLIWKGEITKSETCKRASLYFSSLDYFIWFTSMNNLQGCSLHHSDTLIEDIMNDWDHMRLIWKREITKAETSHMASLYFSSLDSLIWFTFMNNHQGC